MKIDTLKADLIRDEGLKLKPYTDTVGKLTIGVGRNLDDVGITEDEADYLLGNDVNWAMDDLDRNVAWWRDLPEGPARALVNMCFNMGWSRLSGFRNMLAALEAGDWQQAATEALDSRWASQV
ncbi:MAG: glycoside hydrolase family protein, partial [Chloroflexi bacterium]|nr:glycoside hydrolase family protein [Chloroflexota bacterium]